MYVFNCIYIHICTYTYNEWLHIIMIFIFWLSKPQLAPKKPSKMRCPICQLRELYNSYFEWRKTSWVNTAQDEQNRSACQLCMEMLKPKSQQQPSVGPDWSKRFFACGSGFRWKRSSKTETWKTRMDSTLESSNEWNNSDTVSEK